MNSDRLHYVAESLLADARSTIERSSIQQAVGHKGLRGTLREEILLAFMDGRLPHFVLLGKGAIIDSNAATQFNGEDDVIVFDKHMTTPIKMYSGSTNGIYHFNGVLSRIEVKSSLEASDYDQFVTRSRDIMKFRVDVRQLGKNYEGAYNFLFGYDTIAKSKPEIARFYEACDKVGEDALSGVGTVLCILGKGIYRLFGENGRRYWQLSKADDSPERQLVRCAAMVSEMSLRMHVIRSGRAIEDSLEIAIANYLWNPHWEEVIL